MRTDFQRLAVFVVSLSIQTLRVDPARLGRLGIARVEEDHVCGEDVSLVDLHNVADADVALRNILEPLRCLVQHAELLAVRLRVRSVTIPIVAD